MINKKYIEDYQKMVIGNIPENFIPAVSNATGGRAVSVILFVLRGSKSKKPFPRLPDFSTYRVLSELSLEGGRLLKFY